MRIDPTSATFRAGDRRARPERRAATERRTQGAERRRAVHEAHRWLAAPLGAHLLGQFMKPVQPSSGLVATTYAQPERRMPLRPRTSRIA
ncbi:hypothetical protein GC169_02130 [bacterium]|nr:hypothetical protein [bacterium]